MKKYVLQNMLADLTRVWFTISTHNDDPPRLVMGHLQSKRQPWLAQGLENKLVLLK